MKKLTLFVLTLALSLPSFAEETRTHTDDTKKKREQVDPIKEIKTSLERIRKLGPKIEMEKKKEGDARINAKVSFDSMEFFKLAEKNWTRSNLEYYRPFANIIKHTQKVFEAHANAGTEPSDEELLLLGEAQAYANILNTLTNGSFNRIQEEEEERHKEFEDLHKKLVKSVAAMKKNGFSIDFYTDTEKGTTSIMIEGDVRDAGESPYDFVETFDQMKKKGLTHYLTYPEMVKGIQESIVGQIPKDF